MKQEVVAIYSEIIETLTFIRLERGARHYRRLRRKIDKELLGLFESVLDEKYDNVRSKLIPICCELRCQKLKMLIRQVEGYKKEYVGHAAKVKPFVEEFDKIEPALKLAKTKVICGKCKSEEDWRNWGIELVDSCSQLQLSIKNLGAQFELWRHEVKSDRKLNRTWIRTFLLSLLTAFFSFVLKVCYDIYKIQLENPNKEPVGTSVKQ